MDQHTLSRRAFLGQTAGAAGSAWLKVVLPSMAVISQAACTAKEEKAPFTVLTDAEALEFEAIAERIIPATDTPGARDAGVIYFFDQTFGTFNAPLLPMLRGGLAELQGGIDGGQRFSSLGDAEQDAVLRGAQQTPFFQVFRMMTFAGFFGLSQYGGNRDGIGFEVIGMDPRVHSYRAPFGYYDAEYAKEQSDA